MEGYKNLFIFYCSLYNDQGLTGKLFFHGAGRGGERPKIYGVGWGGDPPLPTVWGGAGKESKSAGLGGAGAGNIPRVLIEIICCR